eukprot:gene5743-5983_t
MQSLLKNPAATLATKFAVHTSSRRPSTLAEGGVTVRRIHARHLAAQPLLDVKTDKMLVAAVEQPTHESSFELSAAPDLVTNMDAEASASSFSVETALANGIGWVVEEGLEVTNFRESNFAAVGAPSSSMWLSNSPWCLVWDAYCNVLSTQPVPTKLATGMVGTFLGDMLAQSMQGLVRSTTSAASGRTNGSGPGQAGRNREAVGTGDAGFSLDLSRTARLVGFSALVGTPVAFVWFGLLDQFVLPADPTNPLAVFTKVALDQVFMAPCMTSLFFAAMAWLEGCHRKDEVLQTVQAKLKPTLLANWTVWPLAHVINFALVPPAQRILYINVINIAWTAFMSHMAADSNTDTAANRLQQQPQQARR